MIINDRGDVLTAFHVVDIATSVLVNAPLTPAGPTPGVDVFENFNSVNAIVIAQDPDVDLAVVKTTPNVLQSAPVGRFIGGVEFIRPKERRSPSLAFR